MEDFGAFCPEMLSCAIAVDNKKLSGIVENIFKC